MSAYDEIARTGEALLESMAAAAPAEGELVFWWLGQHSFTLKVGRKLVFIDPYLQPAERRTKPPLLTPAQGGQFDLILCTHDHVDHIDPEAIPGLAAVSDAIFVSPRATRQRMLDLGVPEGRWLGLDDGESATVAGLRIQAIKAAHEFFDVTPDGLHPYLGYVLTGHGVTAWHAGDTVWWEGLQTRLRDHLPIDVAFVPINGRDAARYRRNTLGNLTFAEAADLVGPLEVGLAVPTHFDMFAHNSEDPTRFTDYVAAKYPTVPTWLGPAGEPVTVSVQR